MININLYAIQGIDYPGVGVCAILFGKINTPLEEKILIMKRGQSCRHEKGKWAFPGGGIDHGEKLSDAIQREIKEELNVDIIVHNDTFFCAEDMIQENDVLHHWLTVCSICTAKDNDIVNVEGFDKCEQFEWINPYDEDIFEKYTFSTFTYKSLKYYRRFHND